MFLSPLFRAYFLWSAFIFATNNGLANSGLSLKEVQETVNSMQTPLGSDPLKDFLGLMKTKYGAATQFTLMKSSNSAQGANCKNPRAIVYSNDGKFILTFNGDPNQKGGQKIEIINFDEKSQKYLPYEINFKTGDKKDVKPKLEGPLGHECLQCHGGDPEMGMIPIWKPFPEWNQAFGSIADSLDPATSKNLQISDAGIVGADPKNLAYFKDIMEKEKAELEKIKALSLATNNRFAFLDFTKNPYQGPRRDPSHEPSGNGQLFRLLTSNFNQALNNRFLKAKGCGPLQYMFLYFSVCQATQSVPYLDASDKNYKNWDQFLTSELAKHFTEKGSGFVDSSGEAVGNGSLDIYKVLGAMGLPSPQFNANLLENSSLAGDNLERPVADPNNSTEENACYATDPHAPGHKETGSEKNSETVNINRKMKENNPNMPLAITWLDQCLPEIKKAGGMFGGPGFCEDLITKTNAAIDLNGGNNTASPPSGSPSESAHHN